MDDRIVVVSKKLVRSCDMHGIDVPQIVDTNTPPIDGDDQPMIEDPEWNGIMGYTINDIDDLYTYPKFTVCESCMNKIIKAVGLININKLTKVVL